MPLLTTLLAVVAALCLRDTVADVFLEASSIGSRSKWGVNDILLTCSSGVGGFIRNAVFTRDDEAITISDENDCIPSVDQYCYESEGERLSFNASSVTEGKYACEYEGQTSNELAIVAYPDEVSNATKVKGEWGMELVLPCRYAPGPLANDPANFYHHTWTSVLDGISNPVSSNDDVHNNNTDFSLTFFKLNPVLAEYNYQCGIVFSDDAPTQPYELRSSSSDLENSIDVIISVMEGDVSIERGPTNAVVSANELANFSCTLNVTGNEVLQFEVFGSKFDDRHSECQIDTTSRIHCSWTSDGINLTCDYSVPYQITCNLALTGLTEVSSTEVICSRKTEDNLSSTTIVPSATATATLAVRIGKVQAPEVGKDEDCNNLTISFELPAVPLIPLEVQTVFFKDGQKVDIVDRNVSSETKAVNFSISNSDVPSGLISVKIRVKYQEDDDQFFSDLSDESSSIVINPEPSTSSSITTSITPPTSPPTSLSPTVGGDTNMKENPTVYYILGGFGALLLIVFIFVLILALLLYRKKDGRSGKVELANGYGPDPHNHTPLTQVHLMKDPSRSYSESRSHSPPDNISNTNTTNTDVPDASPSHQSHNGSCYCRMDPSSASEGSHRYLQVERFPRLPRYGYPADDFFQSQCPVHPPPLSLPICAIDSIPGISVQAPTPVTPANTEPFVPSAVNTPEYVDDQFNPSSQTARPGILHIPSSASSPQGLPTPGTSTPISSEVALSIAMYLKHKDCQVKDTCPTCRMIDNRFTKLLTRYETKEMNKLASSSAVKSKLRQKHRMARSPRAANALRPHLVRQRSMSTSHVNEDELTLSSTETEDDGIQMDMDKRRRTKESHGPTRNPGLLNLRDIPKDIAASDSELVSTPSGRSYSSRKATSPMKAARQAHHLPVPSDSLSSNEDSQATDGSDTSSHKHNSHPDLTGQLPPAVTFLPNPASKHHHNSTFNKYHSLVSTSGYSSQSDNDSTVFRPVLSSRQGGHVFCSDESVDNYHSDGYSYNSCTDYPVQRSHQYQRRKVSLDTVVSNPSPRHYPGHHSLERTGVGLVGNGHSQASVYSASAALYSHRPQDRLCRPSSASPSHGSYKSSISYSAERPHARSMSPIVSLPTSQSQATPL